MNQKIAKKMTNQRQPARMKHDDAAQSRAFVKKAREIDADETDSAADDLMGRLAQTPPKVREK